MINTLFLPELREMLQTNDQAGLAEFCTALHPARTAEFMEGLDAQESWAVLLATDLVHRAAIFGFLDKDKQVQILESGETREIAELISEMPADDRVDLINRANPEIVAEILELLPAEQRRDIMRLRQHPEGTAGAVMTTEVAVLPENLTVSDALREIGRQAQDLETIYYIYIVDDQRHLRGLVSARQLLSRLGKPDTKLADFMKRDLVTVEVTDDQEMVAGKVADFDFAAIPVVDHEQHLLGIITHDDVIDVLREEATEDAHRMAAIGPMTENYLELPFTTIWRKRATWLACLFVAELFTFTALAHFEDAIATVLVLSLFVPLCISTGGNSGSQAATLITRAMALGHIGPSEWLRVLRHELAMGMALGLTLGGIAFFRGLSTPQSLLDSTEHHEEAIEVRLPLGSEPLIGADAIELPIGAQVMRTKLDRPAFITLPSGGAVERVETTPDFAVYRFPPDSSIKYPTQIRWRLAIVISQSVAAICLWGTLIGSMLPLLFRKLGFDPGYASSPFVATFVDVTGIVIYFSIAHVWLI